MNKPLKVLATLALATSLTVTLSNNADASTQKVMWGKTELKLGQIGKVTILDRTQLVKPTSDGKYESVRILYPGDEFRVYQYKGQDGGLYGVGDGSFVPKNTKVKYETPSKKKLDLVSVDKIMIQPTPVGALFDIIPNTLKHIENNNITVKSSESNSLVVQIGNNTGLLTMRNNSETSTVKFSPLRYSSENYAEFNKNASKLVSVYFTELGYSVTDTEVKSYIDTYITTGLKDGDNRVTGNLYVKRSSGIISFFTK